jgi:hypothetical protein
MRHGGLLVHGGALLACCLPVLPLSYKYTLKQYSVYAACCTSYVLYMSVYCR